MIWIVKNLDQLGDKAKQLQKNEELIDNYYDLSPN